MKTLTVRTVPDEVYQMLKSLADVNNRSLQEQVIELLERETRLMSEARTANARKWRQRLAGRKWGNVVADIRSERQR